MKNKNKKVCIECKEKEARYWASNFCEECFRELLSAKIQEEDLRTTEPIK